MSDFYPIDFEPDETPAPVQFASVNDVQLRLGRDLTESEEASVDLLLTMASAVIANAVGRTAETIANLDPVPMIVRGFCMELVCRAIVNPNGLFSKSETVGSYSYTESFNKDASSLMMLTEPEVLVLRHAVHGSNSGSARASNVLDDLAAEIDLSEGS